jgi:hypothetical protein
MGLLVVFGYFLNGWNPSEIGPRGKKTKQRGTCHKDTSFYPIFNARKAQNSKNSG